MHRQRPIAHIGTRAEHVAGFVSRQDFDNVCTGVGGAEDVLVCVHQAPANFEHIGWPRIGQTLKALAQECCDGIRDRRYAGDRRTLPKVLPEGFVCDLAVRPRDIPVEHL